MSGSEHERPDPRQRPPDPAGTRPKVDPDSLLPEPADAAVEGEAFEEEPEPELRILLPGEAEVLPQPREPSLSPAAAIPRETKHTPRFQFLLGALLAIGGVALAAAVAVALRPSPQPAGTIAGWSPWQPSVKTPITDIVDHVSHEYRLPSDRQLVAVRPAPLIYKGVPAQIALQPPPGQRGDISLLEGNAIVYRFCGLAPHCAIPGKSSASRVTLLRREALELALYTFHYIGLADQVVVFLPPVVDEHTKKQTLVSLLFQRSQLGPLLARPLYESLATRTPSVAGADSSPDAPLVRRLTTIYTPDIVTNPTDPGGSPFLVLTPYPTTKKSGARASGSGSRSGPLSDLAQILQQNP